MHRGRNVETAMGTKFRTSVISSKLLGDMYPLHPHTTILRPNFWTFQALTPQLSYPLL